jgi:hypothetical protein
MLPDVPIALLVLFALFPGWIFIRLSEARTQRPERSQLAELLEFAAVGFSTTAISALAIAALSSIPTFSFLFNVEAWANTRDSYLGNHFYAALASTALCMALSCAFAIALFAIIFHRRPANFKPGSSVWIQTLAMAPPGMQSWIGVHRHDGSLVEGLLFSCTAGSDDDKREISLTKPIRLTLKDGSQAEPQISRVLIPGEEIGSITVTHVPKPDADSQYKSSESINKSSRNSLHEYQLLRGIATSGIQKAKHAAKRAAVLGQAWRAP